MHWGSADYFGHEDEAESPGVAEDDEDRDQQERRRLLFAENEADGHAKYAHDRHVVDGDAHVLGVIQGRDLHLSCFPSQECAKELREGHPPYFSRGVTALPRYLTALSYHEDSLVRIDTADKESHVVGSTVFNLGYDLDLVVVANLRQKVFSPGKLLAEK